MCSPRVNHMISIYKQSSNKNGVPTSGWLLLLYYWKEHRIMFRVIDQSNGERLQIDYYRKKIMFVQIIKYSIFIFSFYEYQ